MQRSWSPRLIERKRNTARDKIRNFEGLLFKVK